MKNLNDRHGAVWFTVNTFSQSNEFIPNHLIEFQFEVVLRLLTDFFHSLSQLQNQLTKFYKSWPVVTT